MTTPHRAVAFYEVNPEKDATLLIAHKHLTWRLDEAALRRLILCVVEAEDRTVDYLGIIESVTMLFRGKL